MSVYSKGIIVISVDDGSADNYRLYKMLKNYDIPATFNIVTSRVGDGTHFTKEQLCEIYADPLMEIACHSHTHTNEDDDILLGNKYLYEWLDIKDKLIGFASPGSRMNKAFITENAEHLQKLGLLYVRSSGNPELCERHIKIRERLKKQAEAEYIINNVPQLIYDFKGLFVPSVVVYNDTEVQHLKALVNLAAEEKACTVFMFHRIKKPDEENYDNTYSYDFDKTEDFVSYLNEKRKEGIIDVLTTKEAFMLRK